MEKQIAAVEGNRIQVVNGFVIIDLLEPEFTKSSGVINPHTGAEMASEGSTVNHPYRGLVIAMSKFFYNGGVQYPTEIKVGEVVLLPGVPNPNENIIIEGIAFLVIRYSAIYGHYQPTQEEMQSFSFARPMEKKNDPIVKPISKDLQRKARKN